ncbi:MAG: methyl-accepting chemotaxis protein [Prolixibacteraceae bacterium]|jgi:PAS domain S-box-containing protein|nr:methyl-accepting chemotaxis protein [Prolixibacteraceae bacterium]
MITLICIGVLIISLVIVGIIAKRYRYKVKTARTESEKWRMLYYEKESQYLLLEKEKQKSELLARLVEQSPNAIMIMDCDGEIQMLNDGFSKMYGYSFNEFTSVLGKNYRQTSFSPDVQTRLDSVFATRTPFRYEAPNIRRDGRQLWTQTALMPILNDEGEVTHMATIDTDIDQRVDKSDRLVAEMEQLNQKIDRVADEFRRFSNEFSLVFSRIGQLYEAISKTDGILRFIEEISAQTRLLGFNASIEAGRAGEYGNSFRVITSEIVEIAQLTATRVQQIKEIFDSIGSEQGILNENKQKAEDNINILENRLSDIKKELFSIEEAIIEFKSLS